MQNNLKKAALIAVSVVTAVGGMTGCSQNLNGTQIVSTVNDEDIDVGLLNLMVRYQQAETDYFYSMYFGSSVDMWDDVADEETGETYGEQEVAEILESLELLVIMRQHADDYDVTISDEEAAKITEAAQGFIESNDPDTIKKMGVDQAMAEEYLSLYYIQEQMYDPMVADVDTEVSDEEAQQTGITYIEVEAVSDTDSDSDSDWSSDSDSDWVSDSDSDSDWVSDSDSDSDWASDSDSDSDWESDSDSDWESDSDSDWESDSDSSEEVDPAAMEEAQDTAQQILDQVLANPDGDMEEIAQSVDEDLYAATASFTTNPEEDAEDASGVPDDVQSVAKTLKDGEVADELVEAGDAYYIVRLDAMFDEEATEEEKENIVNDRQQEAYEDLTAQWQEESSIEENKSVLKKVKLKDNDKYTLVVDTDSDSDLILDSDSDSDSDLILDSDSNSDADSQETTDTDNNSQD